MRKAATVVKVLLANAPWVLLLPDHKRRVRAAVEQNTGSAVTFRVPFGSIGNFYFDKDRSNDPTVKCC